MKKHIIIPVLFISFLGANYTFAEESVNVTETSTEWKDEVKQLKLNGSKVIWKNKIELDFDSNIDPKSNENDNIDISVKNIWGKWDELFVTNYQISYNKVLITLENELNSNSKYQLVIFSIEWEDGSSITSGLDWALEFTTWDLSVFDKKEEKVEEEKVEEEKEEEEEVSEEELEEEKEEDWEEEKKKKIKKKKKKKK